MLGRAVDQSLARQGDNLGRDGWEVVDRQDAFDLRKQTLDQTKVAACDASDRIDHGGIGVIVKRRVQAKLAPEQDCRALDQIGRLEMTVVIMELLLDPQRHHPKSRQSRSATLRAALVEQLT